MPRSILRSITSGTLGFFSGDIKNVLNEQFLAENGKPDVIITDPPRAGMHEDVVKVTCQCIAP